MTMETDDFLTEETEESLEESSAVETEESLEESSAVETEESLEESSVSQEIVVNFDNISLSTNLNDLGLIGVTLLCIVLILGLNLVWGYDNS